MSNTIKLDECGIGACEPEQQPRMGNPCCGNLYIIYAEYGGRGMTVLRCAACNQEVGDYNPRRRPGERIHWYV